MKTGRELASGYTLSQDDRGLEPVLPRPSVKMPTVSMQGGGSPAGAGGWREHDGSKDPANGGAVRDAAITLHFAAGTRIGHGAHQPGGCRVVRQDEADRRGVCVLGRRDEVTRVGEMKKS